MSVVRSFDTRLTVKLDFVHLNAGATRRRSNGQSRIEKGYRVIGPILRDGAIIYNEITSVADLPEGWTDEQDGGMYRVKRRNDDALFGFNVGPHSWKKLRKVGEIIERTAAQMGRTLDTNDIKGLLYRNYEHPRWDDVTSRCLTCANCTMVCPTCFCTTVEDVTDLTGEHAERWRRWDSCFTVDFTYIHGGSVRATPRSRYRQWMTHKLATWIDQFGTSGCIGCGRCITWRPVGIDITEETRAIRESTRETGAAGSQSKEEIGGNA